MTTIKTITIEYAYTHNLGNYSSVRAAVTFTFEAQGKSTNQLVASLQDLARQEVEDEIDKTLEQAGRPPYFRLQQSNIISVPPELSDDQFNQINAPDEVPF